MKIRSELSLRRAGQQYAVVRTDPGREGSVVFALNETGAFLFRALEREITREELFRILREEYEAGPGEEEEIRRDMDGFLECLRERGVLQEDGDGQGTADR